MKYQWVKFLRLHTVFLKFKGWGFRDLKVYKIEECKRTTVQMCQS